MNSLGVDTTPTVRPGYEEHCVMRWSLDYFLRLVYETSVAFDGDLTCGIIFLALVRANTQHLAETVQLSYSMNNGVIPDEVRRPASVKSISDSLNLPYETVRRHLGKLRAAGYCERVAGRGFVIPEQVLLRPEFKGVISRNHSYFQQMISRLQRAGLEIVNPPSRATGELNGAGRNGVRPSA